MLKKMGPIICFIINVLVVSLLTACITYQPQREKLDEFYIQNYSVDDLPKEIRDNQPEEPKLIGGVTNPIEGDIDDVVYLRASRDYYRIMGYGRYTKDDCDYNMGFALWDKETSMKSLQKPVAAVKEFCKAVGGYEIYCQHRITASGSFEVQTAPTTVTSFKDPATGKTEYMVHENKQTMGWTEDDFRYYVLTPFSKEEIAQWHLGMEVRNISIDERKILKRNTGAIVSVVYEKFPAFYGNLAKDDVITSVNGIPITDASDFEFVEKKLTSGENVIVIYYRNGIEQRTQLNAN